MVENHPYCDFIAFANFQLRLAHFRRIVNAIIFCCRVKQPLQSLKESCLAISIVTNDKSQSFRKLKFIFPIVTSEVTYRYFLYYHTFLFKYSVTSLYISFSVACSAERLII